MRREHTDEVCDLDNSLECVSEFEGLNHKAYIPLRYTRECVAREDGLRQWRIMISALWACTHEF